MDLHQAYKEAMNCTGYENKEYDVEYSITKDDTKKEVIVSFEGSGSILDWKLNFDFLKIPYKYMKPILLAHRGFTLRYKSVQEHIQSVIFPLIDQEYIIKIRGFSQGCTTAIMMHEDIAFNKNVQADTIVFAPPRVFGFWNSKVLKERLKNVTLVISYIDWVPKLPFVILGFKHYGKKVMIGKRGLAFPWNIVKAHLGYQKLL